MLVSQIVVGTKTGELQIFDIASSTMVGSIKAHQGTVWSMHVRPDGNALVTGSADKDIKFWEFEPEAEVNITSILRCVANLARLPDQVTHARPYQDTENDR